MKYMLTPSKIEQAIKNNDAHALAALVKRGELEFVDNKLVAPKETAKESIAYWDQRQLIQKILLNS